MTKFLILAFFASIFNTSLQAQVFNPDPNTADWSNYFSDFQTDACTGSNSIVTIQRPTDTDGTTGKAWKINSPINGRRAELSFTKGFIHKRNKNHYYSWRWRIDANTTITKDVAVFQWKTRNLGSFGTDGSQNYPVNMDYSNGRLKLYYYAPCKSRSGAFQNWGDCKKSNGNQEFPSDRRVLLKSIPVAENEWVELVLRIQRGEAESGNSAGKVQLWVNGRLQNLNVPGSSTTSNSLSLKTDDAPNNDYLDRSVYPKWGIYNSASCDFDITTWTHSLKVYNTSTEALANLSSTRPNATTSTSSNSSITGSWYRLKNVQTNRYMDGNGEKVATSTSSSGNDKQFRFIKQGNFYNIDIRKTGGTGTGIMRTIASENRLKITNLKPRNNSDKLYDIVRLSDGSYSIKATNAGKFLQNNTSNTVTLTVNGPERNNRAKWEFNRIAAAKNAIGKTEELAIDLEAIPSDGAVKSVKIFPNPVADAFSIKLNGMTKAEITITNLLGKTIYKTTVESNILELNKANKFSAGMYIITVRDELDTIYTAKMVVK